jgi:hypothetical protein
LKPCNPAYLLHTSEVNDPLESRGNTRTTRF